MRELCTAVLEASKQKSKNAHKTRNKYTRITSRNSITYKITRNGTQNASWNINSEMCEKKTINEDKVIQIISNAYRHFTTIQMIFKVLMWNVDRMK